MTGPAGVDDHPGPVIPAVAFGAVTCGVPLPRPPRQVRGELAGLADARAGGNPVSGGHRQHVTGLASFQVSTQARVSAIDSSPVTQAAGVPASSARAIMRRASCGLVANAVPAGMPAAAHRAASAVHDFGRYSSRSISAWPAPNSVYSEARSPLGSLRSVRLPAWVPPRHPLRDRAFCRDEDDQGDLVAGHPNGADGASLSSNASARVAMTVSGVVAQQLLPLLIEHCLPLRCVQFRLPRERSAVSGRMRLLLGGKVTVPSSPGGAPTVAGYGPAGERRGRLR